MQNITGFLKKNFKKILLSLLFMFIILSIILYSIPITRYLIIQGFYQAKIVLSRRSIDDILKDPKTDKKMQERLKLLSEIREFGISLGLNNTDSYKSVYDTRGKPVVWAVSACPKDRLAAVHWKFPIVGRVPYLGFFKKEDALKERQKLIDKGYDTLTRPVSAYSTIGILPDPLFSSMLFGSDEYLANTILHEMTHETIFVKSDIPFNESMANFVGNMGGIEFLKHKYGDDSPQVRSSLNYKHDNRIFSDFMADFYEELDKFYKSKISKEAKISGRESIYKKYKDKYKNEIKPKLKTNHFDYFLKLKINNAYILFNRRYHRDYNVFEDLYDLKGKNLKETISFLKSLKRNHNIKAAIFKEVEKLKSGRKNK